MRGSRNAFGLHFRQAVYILAEQGWMVNRGVKEGGDHSD